MANLIAKASGNLGTNTTWGAVATGTGAAQTTITASTNSTTSYQYSDAFTITNGEVVDGLWIAGFRIGGTGTLSIALSDDNGVTATREVTINMSDIPSYVDSTVGMFFFVKFGSTLTADGGSDYKIGFKTSTTAQFAMYRNSTASTYYRLIRTTANATPAAGDDLFIPKEWTAAATGTVLTVTQDINATTSYGKVWVGQGGILAFNTAADTQFRCTGVDISPEGAFKVGTNASPIPRGTNAILELDCGSDGQYFINVRYGGTFETCGQSYTSGKNVVACRLSSDAAASQATLNVDTDTGWKSGANIAVAATSRTISHREAKVLNADAGSSSMVVTVNLSNIHLGTTSGSPSAKAQAHVILLDRNVQVRAVSSSFRSRLYAQNNGSNIRCQWTKFRYFGWSFTGNTNVGIYHPNPTDSTLFSLKYCLIADGPGVGWYVAGTTHTGWTVEDTWVYEQGTAVNCSSAWIEASTVTTTPYSFKRCGIFGGGNANGPAIGWQGVGGDIQDITVTSGNTSAFAIYTNNMTADQLTAYSNNGAGIYPAAACHGNIFTNIWLWHNADSGIYVNWQNAVGVGGWQFLTGRVFGNTNRGVNSFSNSYAHNYLFRNMHFSGSNTAHGTFNQAEGHRINGNGGMCGVMDFRYEGCSFGVATGVFIAHTSGDILPQPFGSEKQSVTITLVNTPLGSTTEVATFNTTKVTPGSYIRMQSHDGSLANSKTLCPEGVISYETSTVDSSPGVKMVPNHATLPLKLSAGRHPSPLCVRVTSGKTATISIKLQKDGSFNGAATVYALANPAIGITDDTLIATYSGSSGSFQTLSGATIAATADGVAEFDVRVTGTAGSMYVDTPTLGTA